MKMPLYAEVKSIDYPFLPSREAVMTYVLKVGENEDLITGSILMSQACFLLDHVLPSSDLNPFSRMLRAFFTTDDIDDLVGFTFPQVSPLKQEQAS